jgi:hypothetical protein
MVVFTATIQGSLTRVHSFLLVAEVLVVQRHINFSFHFAALKQISLRDQRRGTLPRASIRRADSELESRFGSTLGIMRHAGLMWPWSCEFGCDQGRIGNCSFSLVREFDSGPVGITRVNKPAKEENVECWLIKVRRCVCENRTDNCLPGCS